eukprot:TRINITY_DN13624_c0_g1_i1.p1 TRINITY_DN13624_c0_g1~~TRINITY_DN13624_c0_g1_i1.p1  ORF type:complete len:460 (-),score=116.06 TRINITY_DN13624_c0_g1_i1:32-1411(-)
MGNAVSYVIADFVEHPYLYGLQFCLVAWIVYLYSQSSYKTHDDSLTPMEIEELISSWKPDPLVPKNSGDIESKISSTRVITGMVGPHVIADDKECINFMSSGFLNMHANPEVIQASIDCTNIYGVGSCGPRGFYGSIKPHMDLEEAIAEFMMAEESLIFSDAFQTIASVIPAFSTSGDILIVDRGVNLSVQNGVFLSRSNVLWFDHNDVEDFRRVLTSLEDTFAKKQKRVWLVIEGLYANFGDIAPLDKMLEIKHDFPFRIIIDDSIGIGTLGKQGRGVIEVLDCDINEIEIVVGGLGNSLGGVGGFACGNHSVTDHMRLNCTGYVFSASLPPYISSGCIEALNQIRNSSALELMTENINRFNKLVGEKNWPVKIDNHPISPLIHMRYKHGTNFEFEQIEMSRIVDRLFDEHSILIGHSAYLPQEKHVPAPSLRINLNAYHSQEDLEALVAALDAVFQQ